MRQFISLLSFMIIAVFQLQAQSSPASIRKLIDQFKEDPRGPYKDIRWFCPDGSVIPPRDTCKQKGGYQRARYKDALTQLWESDKLYLGQILMGTDKSEFLDREHAHARAKHYLIERYLYDTDDGWIHRRSKYYRGAVQAEDEEQWAIDFLVWVLGSDNYTSEKYFLYRELCKYLPKGTNDNTAANIRNLSKQVADRNAGFMDIRTKIHGNPQGTDMAMVRQYLADNANRLNEKDQSDIRKLLDEMDVYFNKPLREKAAPYVSGLTDRKALREDLVFYLSIADDIEGGEKLIRSADLLADI